MFGRGTSLLAVALLFALGSVGVGDAKPTQVTPAKVTSVQFFHSSKRIVIHFHLPASYLAYGVRLVQLGSGGALTDTVSSNPYGLEPAYLYVPHATASSWSVQVGDGGITLLGNRDYNVFLLYAPRWACHGVTTKDGSKGTVCHHVKQSDPRKLHLGTIGSKFGPGRLVGDSSDEGFLAQAIVSGTVHFDPTSVTVRATGSSSDDAVHIDWVVTCSTASFDVVQRSGGWDDTMPVNDSFSVEVPPGNITSCDIQISAAITADDDSAFVDLKVYAS